MNSEKDVICANEKKKKKKNLGYLEEMRIRYNY